MKRGGASAPPRFFSRGRLSGVARAMERAVAPLASNPQSLDPSRCPVACPRESRMVARKPGILLASFVFASSGAFAQTLGPPPSVGGCGQSQSLLFDDGSAETAWKVRNPTGHADAFNVDFDDLPGNMTVTGIALDTFASGSSGTTGIRYVSLCPDNLAVSSLGQTPDLVRPYSQLGSRGGTVTITGSPNASAGYCPGLLVYDLPDVTLPTGAGVHAVTSFLSGDSSTWLCSDLSSNRRRSFFTSSSYTTPAVALTGNLMMRIVGTVPPPSNGSAYLTVNNSAGIVRFSETDNVLVTLWSTAATQPTFYLQGVFVTGFPFLAVPQLVLKTGQENFVPIMDPTQGTVCGPAGPPCGFAGLTFAFGAFYIDNSDLKKNGNGKIKSTNFVPCLVTPGSLKICNPCACFGQIDDGVFDGTVWKVQNPAGPSDYFNNRFDHFDASGAACTNQTTYTAIEANSFDFCGTGPSWASIGIYGPNTAAGSTTPNLANPFVLCTSLKVGPGGTYGTTYDFPDVNVSTNTALANATLMHVAVQWPANDSCIWIGSDTDGTDDDSTSTGSCTTIPGTASFFTLNGYTTPALLTGVNMQMRIDWF
jgi:hypothetical protein